MPWYALKLDASRPSHLVEVIVSPVSNGIAGEVSGGGVEVAALPEPIDGELPYRRIKQAVIGAEGRFYFETLRPGFYHLISLMGESYVEAVAAIRAGKGKRVEVTESGVVRVKDGEFASLICPNAIRRLICSTSKRRKSRDGCGVTGIGGYVIVKVANN